MRTFATFLRSKLGGPRLTALETTAPAALYGGSAFPIIRAIFDLACRDIDDQLRQLSGIARALEAAFGHADNMARRAAIRNRMSRGENFRLTHYPVWHDPTRDFGADLLRGHYVLPHAERR